MTDLKPAHQVMLAHVVRLCDDLTVLDGIIAQGGTVSGGKFVSAEAFATCRSQDIGALCRFLEALEESIVPAEEFDTTLATLQALTYPHTAIAGTIQTLKERSSPAAAA